MAELPHGTHVYRSPEPAYRLYGLTVGSAFPFRYYLEPSRETPDLRFVYHGVASETDPPGSEVAVGGFGGESGRTVMRLFRNGGLETVVFPGIAAFECSADVINAYAFIEGIEYLVEICLVGNVMAYWLERRGICALHASAVMVDERAVAFIAGTSRGKTTTACGFVAAGHPLLTDDILPAETGPGGVTVRPAFPQMKLLPEQLGILRGDPGRFEKVHPLFEKLMVPIGNGIGCYHSRSVPFGCIYLLDRDEDGGGPSVLPVNRGEALMELVRHSFAAELIDAVDRGPRRLERLAAVARAVPMRRLRIPSGYGRLEDVRLLVLDDMRGGIV